MTSTDSERIPAYPTTAVLESGDVAVLAGLSSATGFRTNLGFTSLASEETVITVTAYTDDGSEIGTTDIELPANGFVQLERVIAEEFGHTGTAWAEVRSEDPTAAFFAHASVVDENTGDPTYIPALAIDR